MVLSAIFICSFRFISCRLAVEVTAVGREWFVAAGLGGFWFDPCFDPYGVISRWIFQQAVDFRCLENARKRGKTADKRLKSRFDRSS